MERKNELLQEYNDSQIFLNSEDDQDKQEYLRIRKSIALARSRKALKALTEVPMERQSSLTSDASIDPPLASIALSETDIETENENEY
jgi:hypothetical protein